VINIILFGNICRIPIQIIGELHMLRSRNTVLKFRKQLGLTQAELAKRLGCTQALVSLWETYMNTPSAKLAFKLVKLVRKQGAKTTVEEVMGL
jgi:DNA-binding transcriptional regulator YiaG